MTQWAPTLTDAAKDKACRKIHEIAEVISIKDLRKNTYGLMAGNTGIALFLYYYWQWSGKEEYYDKASELLLDSMDKITVPLSSSTTLLSIESSFYDGISGVGWGINHLFIHEFIEGEIGDSMGSVDPWLYRRMNYDLQQSETGFLQGATGIGLYAAGRNNRLSKESLRRFVSEFYQKVLTEHIYDNPTDFSIPTGITGLILLLLKIKAKYDDLEGMDELLSFFNTRLQFRIQDILSGKDISEKTEPGWKQNEAGILWAALHDRTGRADDCNDLKEYILESYHSDLPDMRYCDSGLAGGLLSSGHLFNRIYHATRDERFGELARSCYEKELELALFEDPDTKYKVWLTNENGLYGLHAGLMEGLAGIGLALMAAVSDREPYWDECLLLS